MLYEVITVGGLSHCGMHELGKAVYGGATILSGSVTHVPTGTKITNSREAMAKGMGYVSKDRDQEALILAASIKDNVASAGLDKIKTGPFIFPKKENEYVNKQVEKLSVITSYSIHYTKLYDFLTISLVLFDMRYDFLVSLI